MPELILNDEQAKLVDQASGTLLVRDARGRLVGRIEPELMAEMIAELKRRAASPWPRYTSEQVHARLLALEAPWDRTGGFDAKRLKELLAELNAADPGHERRRKS